MLGLEVIKDIDYIKQPNEYINKTFRLERTRPHAYKIISLSLSLCEIYYLA